MTNKVITIRIGKRISLMRIEDAVSSVLLPLLLIFRFILQDGNLNLLYGFGAICFLGYIFREKGFLPWGLVISSAMLIITVFQKNYSPLFNSENKALVSSLKLILCFSLYWYANKNISYYKFGTICRSTLNIYLIIMILALIMRGNSYLWATDYVNRYIGQRVKLFALEPGQVGFVVSFCALFVIIDVIEKGINKGDIIKLIGTVIIFMFSFPMNAILSMLIGIVTYSLVKLGNSVSNGRISRRVFFLAIIAFIAIIAIIVSPNSISNRLRDIILLRDSSFQSRFIVPLQYFPELLSRSKYLGVGLGNMNTATVLGIIPFIYSNSLMFFVVETGIFGICFLVIWLSNLFKNTVKSKYRVYKLPLLVYLIVIQIAGGYFTDPVIWLLYGVIKNRSEEMEDLE